MNKKGGFFSNFILLLLFVALGFSAYYLYQYYPRESIPFNNFNLEESTVNITNDLPSKQFYSRMRYSDRIINYHISESCSEKKASSMKEALDIIESKTVLVFNPTSKSNSVLNILCADISPEAEEKNHFIAGEGGPSKILNTTLYSVILEGKVALYREGTCDNSNVAIHELLHALGFDHNNNKKSILYPTLECDQQIDNEIIDSINKLYKDNSLSDLVLTTANASKSGRYLNFHIEVLNQGLQESGAIKVSVLADGKPVETFDLGTISIGAKKILDVENLNIPIKSKKIEFIVDNENNIQEIYENNNEITLNLISQ
ncbi:MAG: CARDB domain-containing protein [Nanoarchaeota archaeon]